jgi:hypothetical protein
MKKGWTEDDYPQPRTELYEIHYRQAHPRRIDWYRVAGGLAVALSAAAATAALIVALGYVLTAL